MTQCDPLQLATRLVLGYAGVLYAFCGMLVWGWDYGYALLEEEKELTDAEMSEISKFLPRLYAFNEATGDLIHEYVPR